MPQIAYQIPDPTKDVVIDPAAPVLSQAGTTQYNTASPGYHGPTFHSIKATPTDGADLTKPWVLSTPAYNGKPLAATLANGVQAPNHAFGNGYNESNLSNPASQGQCGLASLVLGYSETNLVTAGTIVPPPRKFYVHALSARVRQLAQVDSGFTGSQYDILGVPSGDVAEAASDGLAAHVRALFDAVSIWYQPQASGLENYLLGAMAEFPAIVPDRGNGPGVLGQLFSGQMERQPLRCAIVLESTQQNANIYRLGVWQDRAVETVVSGAAMTALGLTGTAYLALHVDLEVLGSIL